MSREEVISAIERHRLIVIARGFDTEELLNTTEAMYRGGVRLLEVTFDALGNPADEVVAGRIRLIAEKFKGRMHIGAGTVLDVRKVELAKEAGAEFVLAPDACRDVVERTVELGMVSIPGAFTATEATNAVRWGADFIKLFPNSEVSPSYIKALSVPLNHIKFLAVGGVKLDTVQDYLDAGAKGIGIASGIMDKKLIRAGKFDEVTEIARKFTSILDL